MSVRLDTTVSVSKEALGLAQHMARLKSMPIRTFIDDLIAAAFDGLDEKQKLYVIQTREKERAFAEAVMADLRRQELTIDPDEADLEELIARHDLELSEVDFDLSEVDANKLN